MKKTSKAIKKQFIIISVTLSAILSLMGCDKNNSTDANKNDSNEKKTIIMATTSSPYSQLFIDGIEPILQKQGYTIKHVSFTSVLNANIAINEGSVDFNVDQHTAYMNVFNQKSNGNLATVLHIPTVPTAIFSVKHKSLDEISNKFKIAISQDPSNTARAYRLLAKANWITLKDNLNPALISKNDIKSNPYNLEITEMDASNIPRILNEIDYAIMPGSVVYASKVDRKYSLLLEDIIKDYELVVVVNKKNLNTAWAKDIANAYNSQEFKEYMQSINQDNFWFIPK